MHESQLLQLIAQRSAGLRGLPTALGMVETGPGDDAAVVRTSSGDALLITVDQLVVGRHVEADTPIDLIARKAVARSVSDIAAMGGAGAWALATGLLPADYANADELFEAMAKWASHWGCPLIGGDIARSPGELSLTVTVAGTMLGGAAPVLRSGARAGDLLYVTGELGGSLASGRHATFEPRLQAGQRAAALGASAMIDISDGLGRDAGRVGKASGCRLVIDAKRLPIHAGVSGWREAASDGEDYELLIAVPPELEAEAGKAGWLGPIGAIERGEPGAVMMDEQGEVHDASQLGWDH